MSVLRQRNSLVVSLAGPVIEFTSLDVEGKWKHYCLRSCTVKGKSISRNKMQKHTISTVLPGTHYGTVRGGTTVVVMTATQCSNFGYAFCTVGLYC